MDCGSLSSFLSGCRTCLPILFIPEYEVSVCTPGFAMRLLVVFCLINGCIVFDESMSFVVPGLILSSIGVTVDDGEGEGKAVDMTVFFSGLEIKFNSRSKFNGRSWRKILPHMIAINTMPITVAIVRF